MPKKSNASSTPVAPAAPVPGEGWAFATENTRERYTKRRYLDAGSWTRLGDGDVTSARQFASATSGPALEDPELLKSLIAQLCAAFYDKGWVTGTGGGLSIRTDGGRVFVAPSGVQKEDLVADDMFELDMAQNIVAAPRTPKLKLSACTPLWYVVYRLRPQARCVIHTHSMWAQVATLLGGPAADARDTLRVTHLEMLKVRSESV